MCQACNNRPKQLIRMECDVIASLMLLAHSQGVSISPIALRAFASYLELDSNESNAQQHISMCIDFELGDIHNKERRQ